MSYLITIMNEVLEVKYCKRETPYYSNYNRSENRINIFSGELHKVEKYFDSVDWKLEQKTLNIDESFSVVSIDPEEQTVHFANSKSGLEQIFYYMRGNTFILSDDFWEIINMIQPNEDDLDREAIAEYVNLPYALFDTTFIKDVKFLMPGSIGIYSAQTHELQI